jgi:PAS domain S-box-containing protein
MQRSKVRSSRAANASRHKRTSAGSHAASHADDEKDAPNDADFRKRAMEHLACVDEHSPLALIEWSTDLRVTHWSKGAIRLFGWRADQAVGKRADELRLVPSAESARAWAALADLAAGKRRRSTRTQRNVRRDGSVIQCEWYDSAVGAKTVRAIVSLVLDVTDRARAEEALGEAKSQLATIIETIPHGMTTVDREWRYTDVSEHAARAMGTTRQALLGRSIWEVLPGAGDDFRSQCERAWKEQRPVSFEHYSSDLGRWYETFLYPFAGGLSIQGYDITDRKRALESLAESEQRLRTVLENTPEAYAIYDAEGRFEYLNPVGLRVANAKLEDVVGKRDDELWPEEFRGHVPHLKHVYETGLPDKFELDTITVSGEIFTKLISVLPIKDSQGNIRHVLMASHDLTERKKYERALIEADQHKNEFLAVLSHELRNPLTPIRYSLFVLDHAPPGSEKARDAKRIIDRQVDHLARIVDDLLDVTRISRGKIQLQRRQVDLREIVRRAAEDHRSSFVTKGVDFGLEVPKKRVIVDADPARIAQVVGNLLQNAAKFTPSAGRVSLTLKADERGPRAVIEVRDTGVGISAETLPRLFQPFEQAADTLDQRSGGLGLGLALVKALIEMHGGHVEAKSRGLGTGAEFIVTLPLVLNGVAGAVQSPEPAEERARRILIIEDNIDAARGLCEFLRLRKHEVEVAHDGPGGLEKARRFKPEVVFCDIGLPGMDGYQVAKAFRADARLRDAYLVALTGFALPDDRAKARASGFDQHIAKPPALAKLREILAAIPLRK